MIPHSNAEMCWRHIVLEIHPLSNIQRYIRQQFWQHIVHEVVIYSSVVPEWKNVWSNRPINENAGPHINTESLLMCTCTQSNFESQYTFSVSDNDTTAYASTTNKMLPNITNRLQRPYVPYRNIFVLMFSTSCNNLNE